MLQRIIAICSLWCLEFVPTHCRVAGVATSSDSSRSQAFKPTVFQFFDCWNMLMSLFFIMFHCNQMRDAAIFITLSVCLVVEDFSGSPDFNYKLLVDKYAMPLNAPLGIWFACLIKNHMFSFIALLSFNFCNILISMFIFSAARYCATINDFLCAIECLSTLLRLKRRGYDLTQFIC